MLKFMRNKLVGVEKKDQDTLVAHGILDDDIYSLEIDVSIRTSNMEILAIDGRWNRWTTPECPRAIPFLQNAVGFCIEEEGFSQKVHKVIGRQACRHYANLLLECCYTAKEAATLIRGENKEQKTDKTKTAPETRVSQSDIYKKSPKKEKEIRDELPAEKGSGKMFIDLHVHTSPASPCSSVPVDQLIEEAKLIGLDAICLTDHNYVWDANEVEDLRQKHGFLVLRGNEITTDQGDMIVFGLDKYITGIIRLDELRDMVLKVDGYMIVAHPFRGFLTFGVGQLGLTPEKAMARPLFRSVDAVEVLNSKVTEKENGFASQVAVGLGLPITGGSDAHEVSEVGIYATQFSGFIKNETGLIEVLRTGAYSPIAFRGNRKVG
jgi:predicted metal-dependent phosphoesterase TrpH